ncbi:MAG: adenylate kinase [Christensenellaceae bacterium]
MKIILLGAPGAGKGTQAFELSKHYDVVHISTGDIFRDIIGSGTDLGNLAKSYIDKGQLVPDDVTIEIVKERLKKQDCENGYILDGFPRTVYQAEALEKIDDIDKVIDIEIPLEKLKKRLTGRRVCPDCHESYHVDYLNGSTACANCGATLIQRRDDNEETVAKRINVYKQQTQPLIEFYEQKGKLLEINGDQSVDEVFSDIVEALK